jgi:hypothetical protein
MFAVTVRGRSGHEPTESAVINASELVGAPQIAGVVVSPVGLYREIESRTTAFTGGVVVSGKLGPAIGDKLGGKSAAEERSRDATVSDSTPECGKWGFLAVTDAELALTTTAAPKWVGRQLGELVIRVPRSTVAQAELRRLGAPDVLHVRLGATAHHLHRCHRVDLRDQSVRPQGRPACRARAPRSLTSLHLTSACALADPDARPAKAVR